MRLPSFLETGYSFEPDLLLVLSSIVVNSYLPWLAGFVLDEAVLGEMIVCLSLEDDL